MWISIVIIGQWLITLLMGWGMLGLVKSVWRHRLDPASPAIGMAGWIVAMYAINFFVSVRTGAPVLLVIALGLGARRLRAERRSSTSTDADQNPTEPAPFASRGIVRASIAASALAGAGLLGFAAAAAPSVEARTVTVMSTANHDASFYISASEWLIEHSLRSKPELSTSPADSADGPADAAGVQVADRQLRLGDLLVSASAGSLSVLPVHEFWLLQVASWLLFAPGSVLVAVNCFGRRGRDATTLALIGGLALTCSSLLVFQIYNQNSASVLGIVLMPMALGAVFSWLDGKADRLPLGLAAVMLTATLGTYSEFTPIVALGVLTMALARRPSRWLPTIGQGALLGITALAIAPVMWVRLVRLLVFVSSVSPAGFPSLYRNVPTSLLVGRLTGTAWPIGPTTSIGATVAVAVVVAIGLVASVVLHPARYLWIGLAIGEAFTIWYLIHITESDYSHQRAVEIFQPLAILIAVLGWYELVQRLARSDAAHSAPLPAIGAALVLATAPIVTASRSLPTKEYLDLRAVDDSYDDVADWGRRYGGPDGADLTVVLAGYEETLWAVDALRDLPDTSYPTLYSDYALVTSFSDPEVNRYVVVDRTVLMIDSPGAPIEANDRFVLYDAGAGPFTAVAPRRFGFARTDNGADPPAAWLDVDGTMVIVRNASAPRMVSLRMAARAELAPLDLSLTIDDDEAELAVRLEAEPELVVVPTDAVVTTVELALVPDPETDGKHLFSVRVEPPSPVGS